MTRRKNPHGPTVRPRQQSLKVAKEVMERVLAVPWLAPKGVPSGSVAGLHRVFDKEEEDVRADPPAPDRGRLQ